MPLQVFYTMTQALNFAESVVDEFQGVKSFIHDQKACSEIQKACFGSQRLW